MKNKINRLIALNRLWINMIIVLVNFINYFSITGIIICMLALSVLLIKNIFIFSWTVMAAVIFAGGAAGIIRSLFLCINKKQSAMWIDLKLKTKDLFTAYLHCSERDQKGLFSELISKKAAETSGKKLPLYMPEKRSALRLFIQLSSLVIIFFFLLFLKPVFGSKNNLNVSDMISMLDKGKNTKTTLVNSPDIISDMLFPENKKLSKKFEKALNKNDFKAMQDILDEADNVQKRKSPANKINPETLKFREKFADYLKKKNSKYSDKFVSKSEIDADEADKENPSADEDKKTSEKSDKNENKDEDLIFEEFADFKEDNQDNAEDEYNIVKNDEKTGDKSDEELSKIREELLKNKNNMIRDDEDTNPDDESGGGEQAGDSDSKSKETENEDDSKFNKKNVQIIKKEDKYFEILLPDKKITIPIADIIQDSQKKLEEAVNNYNIPLEYEDYIKLYFLNLLEDNKKQK